MQLRPLTLCALTPIFLLQACGDEPAHLPEGGWGEFAVALDRPEELRDEVPAVERGGTTLIKLRASGIEVTIADRTIVDIVALSERRDPVLFCFYGCDPLPVVTDVELMGIRAGATELIVTGPAGDKRRFPIEVRIPKVGAARNVMNDSPISSITNAELQDGLLSLAFEARDANGSLITTRPTWSVDDESIAQIVPSLFLSEETYTIHGSKTRATSVFLRRVGEGVTTLRVSSDGGVSVAIPVEFIGEPQ